MSRIRKKRKNEKNTMTVLAFDRPPRMLVLIKSTQFILHHVGSVSFQPQTILSLSKLFKLTGERDRNNSLTSAVCLFG